MDNSGVSAQDVIEQIKALPSDERANVTKLVIESDDSWIPEDFKQGVADTAAGRAVELDTALDEQSPVSLLQKAAYEVQCDS